MFVGSVADDFEQKIEQKIFHALIDIDTKKIAEEEKNYVPIRKSPILRMPTATIV